MGGVRTPTRIDVWTDAGREAGDMYRIGRAMSSTPAHFLLRILKGQGWHAELRDHDPSRSIRIR